MRGNYIYTFIYLCRHVGIYSGRIGYREIERKKREREVASEDVVVGFKWTFGISYIFILLLSYIYIYIYPPLFSRTGRHHSPLPLVTLWVWVAPATLAPLSLIVIIKIPRCPGNQLTSLTLSFTMFLSFQHHHHSTSLGNIYLYIHTHM